MGTACYVWIIGLNAQSSYWGVSPGIRCYWIPAVGVSTHFGTQREAMACGACLKTSVFSRATFHIFILAPELGLAWYILALTAAETLYSWYCETKTDCFCRNVGGTVSNGGFTISSSVRSLVTLKHVACYYNIHFAENHKLTYLGLPIIEWDSKCVPSLQ